MDDLSSSVHAAQWIALDDMDFLFDKDCPNLILVNPACGFSDADGRKLLAWYELCPAPMSRRRPIVLIALILALVSTQVTLPAFGEEEKRSIQVDGLERVYTLYLPPNVGAGRPRPLLFILHGGGGDVERMMTGYGSRLVELAHADGGIAVVPEAIEKHWNDGREFRQSYHRRRKKDDIGFFRRLLGELKAKYSIDPNRIYFTGVSNGGMMTYRVALEMEAEVAAIAAIVANLPDRIYEEYKADKPAASCPSGRMMNGTDDQWVPWKGGEVRALGRSKYGIVVSTPKTYSFWKRRTGCGPSSSQVTIPDRVEDDGVTAEKKSWRTADGDKEVVLITLTGGGHTAPTEMAPPGLLQRKLSERTFGRQCRDFDAPEIVWQFLRLHVRQ